MAQRMIHLGWENAEDRGHRMLHIFSSHLEFLTWLSKTNGLREWNAGARYIAHDSEVENHSASLTIYHGRF